MKYKVFIDGKEGTTGLRIYDRIQNREDIELITIPEELRKDISERKKCINASDITFLCLPDDAAREAVGLLENEHTKIIDASTAHRTLENWAYGFPELGDSFFQKIQNSRYTAVPGCHASGFIAVVYPLLKLGIIDKDYPLCCNSITGYSGGGKKMIAEYEKMESDLLKAPRQYSMGQTHKHLKEMKKITGILQEPIFQPIVSSFYSGMAVSIGLHTSLMKRHLSAAELQGVFKDYYKNQPLIQVMPYLEKGTESGFLSALELSGYDNMRIYVNGNENRISLSCVYDNLGKGASGAAIECMNIMLGLNPITGLQIKE